MALAFAGLARAADRPIKMLPPVVIENPRTCIIESPTGQVEVYLEPEGPLSGFLPAGMVVEVLDAPWSPREDLWVRIKPPREEQYYGWVATATFVCH
ncbi:MAG: hypothetical protein AAF615_03445 [Pseudomonadota bacterium]